MAAIKWDDEIQWDDTPGDEIAWDDTPQVTTEPIDNNPLAEYGLPKDPGLSDYFMRGVKGTADWAREEGAYIPQDIGAGMVAGAGEMINLVEGARHIEPAYLLGLKDIAPEGYFGESVVAAAKDMAHDKDSFAYVGGEVVSPMPGQVAGAGLKGAGAVSDLAGALLNPVNKLLSKATEPAMNAAKDFITKPSPTGSVSDSLKTLFVQDYKLSDEFVDLTDTAYRTGAYQNQQTLQHTADSLNSLTPAENQIVQYMVSGDDVAFPGMAQKLADKNFIANSGIDLKKLNSMANSFKSQSRANQKQLTELGMLNESYAPTEGLFRELPDVYTSKRYKNKDALKGNLDPSRQGGRTIEGKRGLYDDDGNFIRDFTDAERKIMEPNADRIIEHSQAKQLDDILQGGLMDKTLKLDSVSTKTPEEMEKMLGRKPGNKERGYVRLEGEQYGNLSGKYVSQQVANRLEAMVDTINREPGLWNNYRKYLSHWKSAVTIKNPKTHINNMLGNIGMMTTASDIPASKIPGILSRGMELSDPGNATNKLARQYGLLEGSRVQEIEQLGGTANAKSFVDSKDNIGTKAIKNAYLSQDSKLGSKAYDAYQAEDEVFKLGIFDHYLQQGMSAQDARAATEKIVFDYAKQMPKGVKFLRDSGLIPFVTWSYKSLPMFAEAFAKRPANLALTAGALTMMNGGEDDKLTQPTVGDKKMNVNSWTPYMEYANPVDYASGQLLGGIPQKAAAIASGNSLNFGRMRTLDRKNNTKLETAGEAVKALFDLAPVPGVYKAGNRAVDDLMNNKYNRSEIESIIDRLFISNKPKKSSRNRKRDTRKRD